MKWEKKIVSHKVKKPHHNRMRKRRRLLDEHQFPGYRPRVDIQGVFGDPRAQVIQLGQTQKKVCSCFNMIYRVYYDKKV